MAFRSGLLNVLVLCLILLQCSKQALAWCPLTFHEGETFSFGFVDKGIACHHDFAMCAVYGDPNIGDFMDLLEQKYGRGVRNNDCAGLVRRPWSRDLPAKFVVLPSGFVRLTRFAVSFELVLNTSLEENAFTTLPILEQLVLSDVSKISGMAITNLNALKKVTFKEMKLDVFPKNAIYQCFKLRFIQFSKVKINFFADDALASLSELTDLVIQDSRVKFGVRPFSGLIGLTTLVLKGLNLNELKPGWFRHLSNLRYMDVTHNNLKVIESDTFSRTRSLESLKLSYNQITDIRSGSFDGLTKLLFLDLSSNRLKYILRMERVESLRYIDADDNSVREITSNHFCSVPQLEAISLENNPIDSLTMKYEANCYNAKAVVVAKFGFISQAHHEMLRKIPEAYKHVLKGEARPQTTAIWSKRPC